jgi:hypothetical protein
MRHHRRRRHPRRRARSGRARPGRRAARRRGVPGQPGRLRPSARLPGRVRDRRPGRHRGDRQLWRGPGPAHHRGRRPGRGGGSLGPPGPPSAGQVRPGDAVSAARAAQSDRARGAPKGRDGAVEAIRALMVAKRSAAGERIRTINQARALILTGPDDLRARFAQHATAALVAGIASLRPRPGDVPGYATRVALRELGRRGVPGRPARPPRRAHRPPGHRPRPRPARPVRDRPPTPRRCCSSRPGTTPGGSVPRRPGRTCARPPRSPHHRGK